MIEMTLYNIRTKNRRVSIGKTSTGAFFAQFTRITDEVKPEAKPPCNHIKRGRYLQSEIWLTKESFFSLLRAFLYMENLEGIFMDGNEMKGLPKNKTEITDTA